MSVGLTPDWIMVIITSIGLVAMPFILIGINKRQERRKESLHILYDILGNRQALLGPEYSTPGQFDRFFTAINKVYLYFGHNKKIMHALTNLNGDNTKMFDVLIREICEELTLPEPPPKLHLEAKVPKA